ncbi:MAG: (deoxy)nucleoside triphosphate pyrophosphohydrolase [Erysipelotrichaceae bacterium]|nr:(deoxy)nucleoside triphosphate pyrophosphohydrolase [Erysipelotrichaceae bacterium]
MKTIKVVAAVIKRNNKIFVTQRGYGEFKDGWEFPGGKVEKGETKEEALIREIKEELDTVIKVDSYLDTIEYDYPDFHLSMDCFICSIVEGNLVLKEHEDSKWIKKEEIDTLNWLPADLVIIDKVKEMM